MYEVLIYDSRDTNSEHPESLLGNASSLERGFEVVKEYLDTFPGMRQYIYKIEISKKG